MEISRMHAFRGVLEGCLDALGGGTVGGARKEAMRLEKLVEVVP